MQHNHELFCTDEEYISEDEIRITMECSLCNIKFTGIIKNER